MNHPAYDSEGYELIAGDYVTCNKKLYKINKLSEDTDAQGLACKVLELLHVKSLCIEGFDQRDAATHGRGGGGGVSKTPETDKQAVAANLLGRRLNAVPADFARKLERERDEARALLERN